jgi:hypothetical protein
MLNRLLVALAALLCTAFTVPVNSLAQTKSAPVKDWPDTNPTRTITENGKKAVPARDFSGLWSGIWGARLGNQAKGVQLHPNDGTPENRPPYTPYGEELFKSHKPLEGYDEVPPAQNNDPRARCEPLGFPRVNHYDLGVRIYQDKSNIAMLYQYDNRWRVIWTDGRPLPKPVDGGVELNGDEYREQRWWGYSVGKWIDDYTLEIETVGTMPEDRVWLDNAGRPISDRVKVTETLKRVDYDTLEWSETIVDAKVYARPWQTMKLQLALQDPRVDVLTRYCSPREIEAYNEMFGDSASAPSTGE